MTKSDKERLEAAILVLARLEPESIKHMFNYDAPEFIIKRAVRDINYVLELVEHAEA